MRTTSANYARLTEQVSPFNEVWNMPWATGAWTIDSVQGMAKVASEIVRQATMIGYVNAFLMYALVAAAGIPLCLLARLPRKV